jgi:hypothetical protein
MNFVLPRGRFTFHGGHILRQNGESGNSVILPVQREHPHGCFA